MSENKNTIVAFFTGLIVGAFFGAVFALLYAPEAGDELRQKIQSGAEANWEKANLELEHLKETVQKKSNQPVTQEESLAPQAGSQDSN